MSARSQAEAESRNKAVLTGVAAAATVAAGVLAWPLAIVGAVPTALLARNWWKHRVKNGLRV
jgi:hypothetical protein